MSSQTSDAWVVGMAGDKLFSANLTSLQLQIKTLLEECGGEHVTQLLDTLCRLNASEQQSVLKIFTNTVERLISGGLRLETRSDRERKEFEDQLFGDIADSIQLAIAQPPAGRLQVLDGGKCPPRRIGDGVLDLDKLRNARRLGHKYLQN